MTASLSKVITDKEKLQVEVTNLREYSRKLETKIVHSIQNGIHRNQYDITDIISE